MTHLLKAERARIHQFCKQAALSPWRDVSINLAIFKLSDNKAILWLECQISVLDIRCSRRMRKNKPKIQVDNTQRIFGRMSGLH